MGDPPARADAGHDSAEVGRSRRYGPQVVQLLETLWEASDHLCSKRLAAVLSTLMKALERHGHWHVDPGLRQKLLQISPGTSRLASGIPAAGAAALAVGDSQRWPGSILRYRTTAALRLR
jgi:hypothetical protein